MVTVYAHKHLRIGIELFSSHILSWIQRAIRCATRANPGNLGLAVLFGGAPDNETALVESWFGLLNGNQLAILRDNLAEMDEVLRLPNTSIRIVDAPMIPGDRNYLAQVRGRFNRMNPNLSIEVADQWPRANLDTKINTLFHELSHRILGTIDVDPQHNARYTETMYGITNAQHLANVAPDDALLNAENYGYFISFCNNYVNHV